MEPDVAATARTTASIRAWETVRADALFLSALQQTSPSIRGAPFRFGVDDPACATSSVSRATAMSWLRLSERSSLRSPQ